MKKVQHWYGSDGSAKNERLLKNLDAAGFANKTRFLNPLPGIVEQKLAQELEKAILEKLGRSPDPYYAHAYDALWVAITTKQRPYLLSYKM